MACASERYGTTIRRADPAVLNILAALCFVHQQVLFGVGGDIDLLVCVGPPSTGCACLIYLPAQKVAFSHMCESGAGVRLARSFPPGVGKRVPRRCDKYTGGTLSAAAQTRVGTNPAVNRDLCLCTCVRARAWLCGFDSRKRKGIVKEEGSAFGDKGNYTRARGR